MRTSSAFTAGCRPFGPNAWTGEISPSLPSGEGSGRQSFPPYQPSRRPLGRENCSRITVFRSGYDTITITYNGSVFYIAVTSYKTDIHPGVLLAIDRNDAKERRRKVLQGVWKRRAQVRERKHRKNPDIWCSRIPLGRLLIHIPYHIQRSQLVDNKSWKGWVCPRVTLFQPESTKNDLITNQGRRD